MNKVPRKIILYILFLFKNYFTNIIVLSFACIFIIIYTDRNSFVLSIDQFKITIKILIFIFLWLYFILLIVFIIFLIKVRNVKSAIRATVDFKKFFTFY